MQKSPNIEINAENPYKLDRLSRQEDIANISNLLQNFSSPITMSITAPWGQGKTTFVKMLKIELNNRNCKTVYFSAWETDFAVDPLVAFLGEMNQTLKVHIHGDAAKTKLLEKTKKIATSIAKKAIPSVIKTVTLGAIDASDEFEEIISDLVGDVSKNIVDEYTKNKSRIEEFKNNIQEILAHKDGSVEKIYIFVDELDRCRPTYTIELLERIKHLLEIKGLVFILAIDKIQLIESIKGVYGSGFNAKEYLKRFIDLEYKLPEIKINNFIQKQYEHFEFDRFFDTNNMNQKYGIQKSHLLIAFEDFQFINKLSLRDVEQYFMKFNLILKATPDIHSLHSALFIFLMFVKEERPDVYAEYKLQETTPDGMIDYFYSLVSIENRQRNRFFATVEAYIIAAKYTDGNIGMGNSFRRHEEGKRAYDRETAGYKYAERVLSELNDLIRPKKLVYLQTVIDRIEMLSYFNFDD